MARIVHLAPGERRPDEGGEKPWLLIEPSGDGRFFGSGGSWKESGEWVGYGSLPEHDISLETAIEAAQQWAAKYIVPTIWVEAS